MPTHCIPYSQINYFSSLIKDYLAQKEELKKFYNHFSEINSFEQQIEEKRESYASQNRKILVKALQQQYSKLEVSEATSKNIQLLQKDTTFTVTTGHQLNLFTGPLYFLYKIISTINLCDQLKKRYPDYHFVPVYWMATEDHDFEEINFFNLNGKKFKWTNAEKNAGENAVGELSTQGLDLVYQLFSAEIGGGKDARQLKDWFEESYLKHENLTEATRYLANELFKNKGLVILDAQNKQLKAQFSAYAQEDLFRQTASEHTQKTAAALKDLGYNIQVNPREINLFYLFKGLRKRIVQREDRFYVKETEISWTKDEILQELETYPERFSPNVILRPLYQEVILPNLCYIGGGGELAYWLELKSYFEAEKVSFPILLLRNSALVQTAKQEKKRAKLGISNAELFLKQHELINRKVRKISNIDIDFSPQKEHLVNQFQHLYELAEKTDKSFLGAVKAQEVKQLKGLEHLEKRLLKAQKRKLEDEVNRIAELQNDLFPNKGLQERQTNFSEIYAKFGTSFIERLFAELDPLDFNFKILTFGKE